VVGRSERSHIQDDPITATNYIFAQANRTWFAVQIQDINGQIHTSGRYLVVSADECDQTVYVAILLEQLGAEAVFARVGMEPSDEPFNSLKQLQADQAGPNPMLNSGAIALASCCPVKMLALAAKVCASGLINVLTARCFR